MRLLAAVAVIGLCVAGAALAQDDASPMVFVPDLGRRAAAC
jgi:hypothetical protein